ncbi:MAG TPA: V4R domain-containing protein [Myxococcota bacterium]|nr:V4R domain-containing protein [Myxococcota bacterium]
MQEVPLPLLVDPHDELAREPRLLCDSRLLGALHAEFGERLGAGGAAATLLQLGYLHGLRDGVRLLRSGFLDAMRSDAEAFPTSPRLAIRLDAKPAGATRGAIELTGSWPEHHEAHARSALLGGSGEASCFLSAGYTSGWLSGLHETELVAIERTCASRGDPLCAFVAREPLAWLSAGVADARASVCALPFVELRRCVERELVRPDPAQDASAFDPGSPAVHVWGPVMVLPFSGSEECLRAIDLIGRDPAAGEVSVVVLDLSGAVIDEGFGAVALENVLEAIEAWGAEPVLAGVSPLSERVVGELQGSHLVVRKDLPFAIASAFQIAQAQRRFL